MPFTCAICNLEFQVGELMLSDDKMNLAHESCVKKLADVPTGHISSVTIGRPLPPEPPTPLDPHAVELAQSVAFKVKHGIPVTIAEARKMYEPCLMPSSKLCLECSKHAISICPSCQGYVHQDFGYNGLNCSGRHEAKCEGARKSRNPDPKPIPLITADTSDYKIEVTVGRNGKSKNKKKTRKGRR